MDYFTCLFPYEQLNSKSNKANYCFQNKMAHKEIYKQTNLKKGFKTASESIFNKFHHFFTRFDEINPRCPLADIHV